MMSGKGIEKVLFPEDEIETVAVESIKENDSDGRDESKKMGVREYHSKYIG